MSRLSHELREDLDRLAAKSLQRRLRPLSADGRLVQMEGRALVNLAGNDYLALANHPRLKAAAIEAIQHHGTGAGASRLVTGHSRLHADVEQAFTTFKHPHHDDHASLLLPTGYMANLAVLTTLARPGDLICLDKLCHASLVDAARASGATVRVFPHLNYDKLERLLTADRSRGRLRNPPDQPDSPHRPAPRAARTFIVTDSVFSMDGDVADLPRLCDLAEHHGALLVVDEAHATGILGPGGRGMCALQGVTNRVDVVVSTASKALGGLGGVVTARRAVIDTLITAARPFLYTTAVPPAQAATLGAALDVVRDEPWRRQRVAELAIRLRDALARRGWRLPPSATATPIAPLIVGGAQDALALQAHLVNHGLLGVAIRPPTVSPGSARVRITLRCDLTDDDLTRLLDALDIALPTPC